MYINKGSVNQAFALERIAKSLKEASSQYIVILKPENYEEEMQKWLDAAKHGRFTEPTFSYDSSKLAQLAESVNELNQLRRDCANLVEGGLQAARSGVNPQLLEAILELVDTRICELAKPLGARLEFLQGLPDGAPVTVCDSSGSPRQTFELSLPSKTEVQRWCREYKYGAKTSERGDLFATAFSREEIAIAEKMKFTAAEVAEELDSIIRQAGYREFSGRQWRAEVSNEVTSTTFVGTKRVILVPENKKFSGYELAKLIAHEVESHLRARLNVEALIAGALQEAYGDKSPLLQPLLQLVPMLARSMNGELSEGCAKYREVQLFGSKTLATPAYGIAVYAAFVVGKSFGETARQIADYSRQAGVSKDVALKKAWKAAYRTFRGGGCTKDLVYKRGLEMTLLLFASSSKAEQIYSDHACLSVSEVDRFADLADLSHAPYPYLGLGESWLRERLERVTVAAVG